MKKLLNAVLAMTFLFSITSCEKVTGEGPIVTQERTTAGFNAVAFAMSGEITVTQGATFKVELQAQQNILDVIETNVINNELVVKVRNGVHIKNEQISVKVTLPIVNGLRISGSGNMIATAAIISDDLAVNISGSGNIHLPSVTAAQLQTTISGSGNIRVMGGSAQSATTRISGSGDIDLINIVTNDVKTTTSGSGTTRVYAVQKLHVSISGSGSVYYKGTPIVTSTVSGSGSIIHL